MGWRSISEDPGLLGGPRTALAGDGRGWLILDHVAGHEHPHVGTKSAKRGAFGCGGLDCCGSGSDDLMRSLFTSKPALTATSRPYHCCLVFNESAEVGRRRRLPYLRICRVSRCQLENAVCTSPHATIRSWLQVFPKMRKYVRIQRPMERRRICGYREGVNRGKERNEARHPRSQTSVQPSSSSGRTVSLSDVKKGSISPSLLARDSVGEDRSANESCVRPRFTPQLRSMKLRVRAAQNGLRGMW